MLKFLTHSGPIKNLKTELLLVRLFEEGSLEPRVKELNSLLGGAIESVVREKDFSGKLKEALLLFTPKVLNFRRVVLVGLGKKQEYNLEKLRIAISATAGVIQKHQIKKLAILTTKTLPPKSTPGQAAQTMIESLLLSAYQFAEYKKLEKDQVPVPLEELQFILNVAEDRALVLKGAEKGRVTALATNYARDLSNQPGNVMTPEKLAQAATNLAKEKKFKCQVLEKKDLQKLGMGALLAVNQGSALPPKFIILEYQGQKAKEPVVLVGKGITFDSGGISIKPSKAMEEMKFDMSGAATVLGIMKAAAELGLPQNLVGLIPATENLPSGSAIKPGDIVKALSGKTIEVTNTDAEGRMILADALAYAARYKPKLVIDFATLTGAVVVALGTDYAGAFGNDERLLAKLKQAGEKTGEKIWPLPLASEYKEKMKGSVADLDNIGTQQGAGSITGALFLQEFVSYPWIHLDIAGTAWTTEGRPYRPKGATGIGVRLVLEFLR